MCELGDPGAPEQSERREPALTFVDPLEAERLAGLQQQLALDGLGSRPLVADDEHVLDEDLRTLPHAKHDVGTGTIR